MAKRDKLYTVNKWNKPFFEEERRKKLFLWGGDSLGIKPGLNEGLAGLRWGYGNTWGSDYVAPVSSLTKLNSIDRAVKDFNLYSNPNYWQNLNRVWVSPTDNTTGSNTTSDKQNITTPASSSSGLVDTVTKITNSVPGLIEGIKNTLQPTPKWHPTLDTDRLSNILNSSVSTATSAAKAAPAFNFASTATSTLANSLKPSASQYVGLQVSPAAQSIIAKQSQGLADNLMQATKSGGISNLGKAGIGIGASILGDVGKHFISNGLNTTAGTLIDHIGSTAGSVVSFIPGVGWVAGPAITLASKLLSGVANAAFGSEYKDNGATAYTNWLNNLNTNVDNSQGVNLLTSIGAGQQATSRNGWLNHSAERRADKTNKNQALALEGFRRGINNSFLNNNWLQTLYALNNITAMGGKLNKCKCNKKSYGGYLDSATPTGFNFLSDLTNIQMQKNQNQGDTATSVGNSFMNTPDMGITFAKGGSIHINPAHKGDFTAKAKRHGMGVQQFASHVLAHKDKFPTSTVRQAVFAKNSRTWQKAFGGKLNYGKDQDIRNNSFFNGATLYELGGILQAGGSNWGNVTEINEGGTHELSPYDGVLVGVDPEGTPNLVEEGEVIFNDYVFSNRITVPKEVCKRLRIGQKKNGYTFADAAKKLLVESKERPNDPISKNGLEANMQLLEDAQEEVKRKMEAEQAVEQFNSLPPEQQVAIMNQEGQRAQDAVTQEQMAQEIQNMPPEQQQAIAQQMMAEQAAAQGLGVPQGQPSPEEQAMMQQQMAQQQGINPQEAIAQASAMQQQALGGMALGGKLCFGGRRFAEGGELNGEQPTEQTDNEMAKYSDEELQDMIDDYREAESGEVKVTKGKLARLKKKAEKAQTELERRHAEEQSQEGQEARQEPTQEELQAAAQEQAMQAQQPIEGQPQEGMPLEGMSPEQAMMMQQQMGGQPLMSPEEMAAMELQQQGNGQYAYGGRVNKFAYAGPLKPQPVGPGITREVQEPYKRHPDIPQEVYDWFLSLTPEERADLFNGSPVWDFDPVAYNTHPDNWYEDTKRALARPNQLHYWSKHVTTASDDEYMRKAIMEAYKNRRSSDGKYIPNNIPMDIMAWYARLPEDQQKKIVANTKAQGKDFNGIIKYALSGSTGPVANAIIKAYNAADGQIPTLGLTSDATNAAAITPANTPMSIYSGQSTTGTNLMKLLGFKSTKDAPITLDELGIKSWNDKVDPSKVKRETLEKATNPVIKHLLNLGWSPFYNGPTEDQWWENSGGAEINFSDAGVYDKGYTKEDVNNLAKRYPQVRWALENNADFINSAYKNGRISGKDLIKAFENSPMWTSTNDYLFNGSDALLHQLDYLARRRQYDTGNQDSRFLNTWGKFGDFTQDSVTGKWSYKLKKGVDPNKFTETFRNLRNDGKFGTMYDVRQIPTLSTTNYVLDENGNPTEEIIFDTDGYTQVGNPYIYYSANTDDPLSPGVNNTISYWKKNSSNTDSSTTDGESNYLTVGWKPKIDYTGLALGVAPGLTGLAMQLGRGAPDMSELDKAVAAYERNTGTMVAPHLTHGLIRPAIIDPRVTENSLNARRLGTNRLLMNTGSTPSRGATILANDANTIGQLGQAMINNWRENRQQEQAAAAFNRETNTTNANILNQVDQFNAQTQSALARDAAQLRYNVAKDKIAARDAYYAGLMGNLGSVFKGGYEAWRENQRKNERDLLAASGVFGETNNLIDDWLGISKVDPKTHKVVRGYNTGMYYWINPNTGKAEYLKTPPLATNPINACGGKIKKNKKRKGYTF